MKRVTSFNHLFLTSTTMLTIASCGVQNNKGGATGFSSSASMSVTRDLTSAERTIATRICYAYQSKNTSFRTQSYYSAAFTFDMNKRDCGGASDQYSIVGTLQVKSTGELFYSTTSSKTFIPKVQTSSSGFLASLCKKIQNNLPVSNTATDTESGVTVQVVFTSADLDSYVLNYFTPKNNIMKIQAAETFKVRTQFNQGAGQILGMDEVYTKQAVCESDEAKYAEISQTYRNYVSK